MRNNKVGIVRIKMFKIVIRVIVFKGNEFFFFLIDEILSLRMLFKMLFLV